MHESGFMRNIAIVGLADLALVIAIIVLGIWKYRKDKGQKY
jgi:FtsZ-interacting cell division protein ZipA